MACLLVRLGIGSPAETALPSHDLPQELPAGSESPVHHLARLHEIAKQSPTVAAAIAFNPPWERWLGSSVDAKVCALAQKGTLVEAGGLCHLSSSPKCPASECAARGMAQASIWAYSRARLRRLPHRSWLVCCALPTAPRCGL